jgi:plastocyanin
MSPDLHQPPEKNSSPTQEQYESPAPHSETSELKTSSTSKSPTVKLGKLVLALALLFAIIVAALFVWSAIASRSESPEVSITANGFEPNTILVSAGTKVTWVNRNSEPHWVASNPHPDHSDLPGLDSEEPLGPGESYSYVFKDSGRFGYHDHLNPETNGTVIVE